jgi:DNA-binding GntR family transcriptional regulator
LNDKDIYKRIVSAILDHRLAPGTKLVEDKLGTAFGVSRTRIRPVLVRLANEQIVTLTPHRGASVALPSMQEAHEVFEVRRMIEPTLVSRFIERASAAEIDRLERFIIGETAARQAGDVHRAIRLSGDFHLHIAEHAGQQTLGRILRGLVSRTSLVLMTYGPLAGSQREQAAACGCRQHQALLDAIRLRIVPEAGRLMHEHLSQIESELRFIPPAVNTPDFMELFAKAA